MLVAALLWLVLGSVGPAWAELAEWAQIIPSALKSCIATCAFWLIVTLLFGRVYCSTVCPVGTLQDITVWVRHKTCRDFKFRYEEGRVFRYVLLIAYIASLFAGVLAVGYILDPWNMMRNVASAIRPSDVESTWMRTGLPLTIGIASGAVALITIMCWAWWKGRSFCNKACPIGTMLGCIDSQAMMHIAIDPDKCISCMKCEDVCSSRCIKVEKRYVDNSRCVKCMDCIDICPNAAISFQINKNRRRQTPLLDS